MRLGNLSPHGRYAVPIDRVLRHRCPRIGLPREPDDLPALCDPLPEFLADLEVRHGLGRHLDRLACLRISAQAGGAVMRGEDAEAANLDAIASGQGGGYGVKEDIDAQVDVLMLQLGKALGDAGDQFGLGHLGMMPDVRFSPL